jgi:hypothetical protein
MAWLASIDPDDVANGASRHRLSIVVRHLRDRGESAPSSSPLLRPQRSCALRDSETVRLVGNERDVEDYLRAHPLHPGPCPYELPAAWESAIARG